MNIDQPQEPMRRPSVAVLIDVLKRMPPEAVVMRTAMGFFDAAAMRGPIEYDGWLMTEIKILTPPPRGAGSVRLAPIDGPPQP